MALAAGLVFDSWASNHHEVFFEPEEPFGTVCALMENTLSACELFERFFTLDCFLCAGLLGESLRDL